jgi:hypothetical protein
MIIIGAILTIVVFIALLYVIRRVLRTWIQSEPAAIDPLEELRRLRDAGELLIQEFDAARNRIVEQMKAKLTK